MPNDNEVRVTLNEYTHQVAREVAWLVIDEHTKRCPIAKVEERLDKLEGRFNVLIGAIIASGGVGGAVGAGILKMFGG